MDDGRDNVRQLRQRIASQDGGRFDQSENLPWLEAVDEANEPIFDAGRRKMLLVVGSVVVVALFASLLFYVYNQSQSVGSTSADGLPLITAAEGPTKVEPEDVGGMEVPDQDRLIFDRVTGEASQSGETIQAGPEQPLERPQPSADTPTEQSVADTAEPTQSTTTQSLPAQTNTGTVSIPNTGEGDAPTMRPAIRQQDQTISQPPRTMGQTGSLVQNPTNPASQTISEANTANIAGFRLQLGAFGTQETAANAWQNFRAAHPNVLGPLSMELQPVVRPDSPTLYRLRAGVISSRQAADDACNILRASGQACFVVDQ